MNTCDLKKLSHSFGNEIASVIGWDLLGDSHSSSQIIRQFITVSEVIFLMEKLLAIWWHNLLPPGHICDPIYFFLTDQKYPLPLFEIGF